MNPKQSRLAPSAAVLCFILFGFFAAAPLSAQQDTVTVGTVTASGNTVDVPVYVRDVSGTPLGRDQAAGSRIQSFSITVDYAPAAAVQSVTFTRAGITAPLSTPSEGSPGTPGTISWFASFDEATNLVPFTINAPAPGDQVAHLVFTLSSSAAPGSSITLTLGSGTLLSNQAGTLGEAPPSSLTLVNGAINIPTLTVAILPNSRVIGVGDSTTYTVQTSANVGANTTVIESQYRRDAALGGHPGRHAFLQFHGRWFRGGRRDDHRHTARRRGRRERHRGVDGQPCEPHLHDARDAADQRAFHGRHRNAIRDHVDVGERRHRLRRR